MGSTAKKPPNDSNLREKIAENLGRIFKGREEQEVAGLLGTTTGYIRRLLLGRAYLNSQLIEKICEVFNVQHEDVMGSVRELPRDEVVVVPLSEMPSLKQGLQEIKSLDRSLRRGKNKQ